MCEKEFNKDVRELMIRTKVSTLLQERPVVLLKQESTVELALQVTCILRKGLHYRDKHVNTPSRVPLKRQVSAGSHQTHCRVPPLKNVDRAWALQVKQCFPGLETTDLLHSVTRLNITAPAHSVCVCLSTARHPVRCNLHPHLVMWGPAISAESTMGCVLMQTLASRKILSAPVVGAPEGSDPTTFTANTEHQDIVCFVDIRDVSNRESIVCLCCTCTQICIAAVHLVDPYDWLMSSCPASADPGVFPERLALTACRFACNLMFPYVPLLSPCKERTTPWRQPS